MPIADERKKEGVEVSNLSHDNRSYELSRQRYMQFQSLRVIFRTRAPGSYRRAIITWQERPRIQKNTLIVNAFVVNNAIIVKKR